MNSARPDRVAVRGVEAGRRAPDRRPRRPRDARPQHAAHVGDALSSVAPRGTATLSSVIAPPLAVLITASLRQGTGERDQAFEDHAGEAAQRERRVVALSTPQRRLLSRASLDQASCQRRAARSPARGLTAGGASTGVPIGARSARAAVVGVDMITVPSVATNYREGGHRCRRRRVRRRYRSATPCGRPSKRDLALVAGGEALSLHTAGWKR